MRYVGEPVAVVVATDRARAEDAVELINVEYRPRGAVVDPLGALVSGAPVLHDGFPGNLASDRAFRYGDPEKAFAEAPHRFSIDIRYPRNSCTPIETYGVVAAYDAGEDAYDVLANFQGPFSIHAVIARALKVPGNRLRLRTPPDSGGSFGVKQGVFPYIVLIAAAARVRAGRSNGSRTGSSISPPRFGDQPRDDACRRRSRLTAKFSRSIGTRSRIAARICARRSRRRSTACTAI